MYLFVGVAVISLIFLAIGFVMWLVSRLDIEATIDPLGVEMPSCFTPGLLRLQVLQDDHKRIVKEEDGYEVLCQCAMCESRRA